ncbi:MAG TPA: NAD(P)H-hydrate dehydratase, partial [Methylomirabilota bacterium]|nr:NAD(P)H-hydrate dehydratase [Methylomirabilota bacterium]
TLAKRPCLIVDGLFGIGLDRRLDPAWIEFIDEINHAGPCILSIDVPSGLNAESGEHMGTAIEADLTLTVGAPKEGLVQRQSYRYVGRLEVLPNVGLVPLRETKPAEDQPCYVTSARYSWTTADEFGHYPPNRRIDAHKGTLGHTTIIAGSLGYHGAAVLAAQGALHARPGLVTLFTPENVYQLAAAQLSAAMVHPWYRSKDLPQTATSLLIGPGLAAPGTAEVLRDVVNIYWQHIPLPVIVDASALDWLQPGRTPLSSRRVITPHPGEAARMLETKVESVQQNRFAALKELSSRFGNCWVVLKGHQTLVGRASGELYINSSGNPDLAQGGAGDVLAGFMAGLLAQPRLQSDPLKVIRYAVWRHGHAADELSRTRPGWVVGDLVQSLRSGRTPIAL